jgi:hypothetical protein
VQSVAITNSSTFNISVDYLDGSRAKGTLCVLIYLTPERTVDLTKSLYVVVERNGFNGLDYKIPNSNYIALGYDVESDALVQENVSLYPAWRKELTVTNNPIGMP